MQEQRIEPNRILFPYLQITRGAFAKAQAFVNATIQEVGLVESLGYGLRLKADPTHTIRDVCIPEQTGSPGRVRIEPGAVDEILLQYKNSGYVVCMWFHHHVYGGLFPSPHSEWEINDKDNNEILLNLIGLDNYKTYDRVSQIACEGITRRPDGTVTVCDNKTGIELALKLGEIEIPDECQAVLKVPINYSYVFSMIMNPTVRPPGALAGGLYAISQGIRKMSLLGKLSKNKAFRPYAEVAYRRWTYFAPGGECLDRQVPIKIIDDSSLDVDYNDIQAEVKRKVHVMPIPDRGLPNLSNLLDTAQLYIKRNWRPHGSP